MNYKMMALAAVVTIQEYTKISLEITKREERKKSKQQNVQDKIHCITKLWLIRMWWEKKTNIEQNIFTRR